ncbi:hypothetical protein M0804_013271 [Polistes exclamans]|nr:hypothetical protein M0804_013271 [Polistes exclamans]
MASEGEDMVIHNECANSLSEVSVELDDGKKIEDIITLKEQSESESSDDSEAHTRNIWQLLSLSNDSEESDEDYSSEWLDYDLSNTSNEFEGFSGPNGFPRNLRKVENVVKLFIEDDLFELISTLTNKYYNQNSLKRKPNKIRSKFVDLTVAELKQWFGLTILMGIVKKQNMNDYWSTNPLLETPIFRKTMSRYRFRQILLFLHFSDDDNKPENADRLFKVQTMINYFSKKFQEISNLSQNNIKMIRISSSTIFNAKLSDITTQFKKSKRTIKESRITLHNNKYMVDEFFKCYPIYRETTKWSKKVMFYLFYCTLYNAFKFYQHYNNAECKNLSFYDFLLKISGFWIRDYLPEEKSKVRTISHGPNYDSTNRLSGQLRQHQLIRISKSDKRKQRSCYVCYKNHRKRLTNLMCKFCGVALHLGNCFAFYHLKKKYY